MIQLNQCSLIQQLMLFLFLTPLEEHFECSIKALQAGKHVLVEKPVSSTVDEIQQIHEAADKAGKLCVPVHNYLYEDSIIRTKELSIPVS